MTTPADFVPILQRVQLFASTSPEDLETLAQAARLRRYPAGQVLFNRGDPTEGLVIVVSGRVQVVVRSADGGQLMLVVVGSGDVLGELSIVDGGGRSADAEALDDIELLLIPREDIMALARRTPAMAVALLEALAASLRRLTDFAADLVFLDLPRRVAKTLLTSPRDRAGVVDLGMSQERFAHRVGGTRQSVNAALRSFERRGWLHVEGRKLTIRDADALSHFAGDDLSAT